MLPSEAWSSPPELFMKPEVNLQRLKGFKGFIFGRKDVGLPIMYDLYDENYILYNYFRPFLSSSEVQNLQRLQTSVQAFTWLLSNLKILASLSSSSLQVIFTDFILGRTKWPWKGIKPKGHVHFLLFSSFILFFNCSLTPPSGEMNNIKRFFRRWRFFGGLRLLSIGHVRYTVGFGWNDAQWKICRFFNVIGWLNGKWIYGRVSTTIIFLKWFWFLFPGYFDIRNSHLWCDNDPTLGYTRVNYSSDINYKGSLLIILGLPWGPFCLTDREMTFDLTYY